MTTDFIIIPRELFRDEALSGDKYSRREALMDLIQQATYADEKTVRVKGGTITLKRGQIAVSLRFLADRWGWSTGRVARTLNDFVNEGRIEHTKNTATSIITILNYDAFQGNRDADGDTNKDTDKDKSNKDNKENKDKEKELQEKEVIEHLYSLYPTKTYRGDRGVMSTGKCEKDKTRIAHLLKTHTPQQIENSIKQYIEENNEQFLKNFSTFLNNMPEDEGGNPPEEKATQAPLVARIGETKEERDARLRAKGYH